MQTPPDPKAPKTTTETEYHLMLPTEADPNTTEQKGPFTTAQVAEMIIRGQVGRDTQVWCAEFGQNWRTLAVARDLKKHLPPPPATDGGNQRGGRNQRQPRDGNRGQRRPRERGLNTKHEFPLPSFGSFGTWFTELVRYSFFENLIPLPASLRMLLLAARAAQEAQNQSIVAENVQIEAENVAIAKANEQLTEGTQPTPFKALKALVDLVKVPDFIPNIRVAFVLPEHTKVSAEKRGEFDARYAALANTELGPHLSNLTAHEAPYRMLKVTGKRTVVNVPIALLFEALASPGELRYAGPIFVVAIPEVDTRSASGMTRFKAKEVVIGCCGDLRDVWARDEELYTAQCIAVVKTETLLHEGQQVEWNVGDYFFNTLFMQGVIDDLETFIRATSDIYQKKVLADNDDEIKKGRALLAHNPFATALASVTPAAASAGAPPPKKDDVDKAADKPAGKRPPRKRPGNKEKKGAAPPAGG